MNAAFMNAARLAIAGVLAALFTVLSSGSAQAYPDPVVSITLPDATFVGGKTLSFSASSGDVQCAWTATFDGQTLTGSGTTFSGTFSTPKVDKKTVKALTVSCAYESVSDATTSAVASASASVTLLPLGSTEGDTENAAATIDGALPDTGGSNVWILIGGGVLVLVGGGAVLVARRRA